MRSPVLCRLDLSTLRIARAFEVAGYLTVLCSGVYRDPMADIMRPLDEPVSLAGLPNRIKHVNSLFDNMESFRHLSPVLEDAITGAREQFEDIVRIFTERLREYPTSREELRFWERVKPDGKHLIWLGMGGKEPRCDWTSNGTRVRTTPARVAWLLLKGLPISPDYHLRRKCERERCISPDCQELASDYQHRPSLKRVRKDVLPDGHGGWLHARCGNKLSRAPRPGQPVYCRTCRQEDVRLLRAAELARQSQLRVRPEPELGPPPVSIIDRPADDTPTVSGDSPATSQVRQRLSPMQYDRLSPQEKEDLPDDLRPGIPDARHLFDDE